MSLRASMRRDQRRRLLASRQRDAAGTPADDATAASPVVAGYDDEAHPERHPALATRLPVGGGRFVLAALGILAVFAAALAVGVAEPLFGRSLVAAEGRFAGTLAALAGLFDPHAAMPLQAWLAELALLLAAAVAGAVRFMRRHRRDDYKGRFRAWGWLAWLLTAAAWAGAVPLGPLVAALGSEVSGVVLGPSGIGWWTGLAAVCLALVVPWAVLPLRERAATILWLVPALACWAVAAVMPWVAERAGGVVRAAVLAQSAWVAGAALMLISMLAAARSVIREVRGQVAAPAAGSSRSAGRGETGAEDAHDDEDSAAPGHDAAEEDAEAEHSWQESDDVPGDGDSDDDADAGRRRLSKAERKRLRKLARMNGTAA